jgi:hypothetical protein
LHNGFRAAGISGSGDKFICSIVLNVVKEIEYALRWPRRSRWRR